MTEVVLEPQVKPRLHGLDYLRGLAAGGIMTYHYASWTFGEQAPSSFLGRVGIYGVAIFYILSGQALSYMYASTLTLESANLRDFYKKRLFRIFPLLWLATLISIGISKHLPNFFDLALNLTGLFGLFKWDTYFATGAWSIGNELTFYLAFPLLIYLLNKNRAVLVIVVSASLLLFIYFAYYIIVPSVPLSSQWHAYTNPANQFIFFLGGTLIGRFISPATIKSGHSIVLGTLGLAIFILTPVGINTTGLITNFGRLIFTISCFLLCCSFFSTSRAVKVLDKPLAMLGQISYSLYLLHPIVYAVVKVCFSVLRKQGLSFSTLWVALLSTIVSLGVSYFSYHFFERFFIKLSHTRKEIAAAQ